MQRRWKKIAAEEAAKKAAEEEAARKAAEEAARQSGSSARYDEAMSASADDQTLLAAIIYCEAGNQPHDGKVGVGAVMLNRVRSGSFPNSIREVIYQAGQFGPAITGKLDRVLASGNIPAECYQAAADALAGYNPIGDALYFRKWKLWSVDWRSLFPLEGVFLNRKTVTEGLLSPFGHCLIYSKLSRYR